jgi:pimeloyl-ACP methyl ester carboxylesterase
VIPETSFVRSGDADLAYKVIGEAERDLLFAFPLVSNVDVFFELPENARFVERLVRLGRVILFDKRGTGMSDRTAGPVAVEQHSDDLVAVLDAAGSSRAVLLGWFDGGATCLVTAARHPSRVESVVAGEVLAVGRPTRGFPWGFGAPLDEAAMLAMVTRGWGQAIATRLFVPEWAEDPRLIDWVAHYQRLSATPNGVSRVLQDAFDLDIRAYLPDVAAPVLVVHNEEYPGVPVEPFR